MPQPRNTALTARSVLASALLGSDPPELPVAYLLRLASLFGVNGNRARVALSRMVAAGEAGTDGRGRYRLAGHLLDRRQRQAASRSGRTRPWRGGWHQVVVATAGSAPGARARRRRALAFARLGELREGVWLRPDNLDVALPADVEGDVVRLACRTADDEALCARLWPLDRWAARAEELADGLVGHAPGGWPDLAPGFELSAAVLRHLQADPLLPPELLPGSWPGERLRAAYDDWDGRYRELLAAWSRAG
ncbi:MAG: PaaX family transcriptional regulator C-terminal domain-containing protein [Acidimicrobiales bacterium]